VNVLLIQLDGAIPSLALMHIAGHHKAAGDTVELSRSVYVGSRYDRIYASAIFTKTRPKVEILKRYRPDAFVGGTCIDNINKLSDVGIHETQTDYSLWPEFKSSIGYSQRGCRLKCSFCGVPEKEGNPSFGASIYDIWRGDPWPREILLLDNDFFGIPQWRDRIKEIREGKFKVSFNQGVNLRLMNEEQCEAVASVDYRSGNMKDRRFYTAWDNRKDETILFRGLEWLCKYGMKPDHLMVYMLIGYWPGETAEDRDYRRKKLREFGARPYPMPYTRSRELVGFQRWVIGAYDKRVSWADFEKARYEPRNL
jgi:hypothetical protein